MSSALRLLLNDNVPSSNVNNIKSLEEIYDVEEYIDFLEEDKELNLMIESMETIDSVYNSFVDLMEIDISVGDPILNKSLDILLNNIGLESDGLSTTTTTKEEGDAKKESFITKVWNAIKKAMVAVADKISSFYRAIFDNTKTIEKNCDKLLGIINDLSKNSATASKTEIDLNLSRLISKSQGVQDISNNINNLMSELQVFVYEAKVIKLIEDRCTAALKITMDKEGIIAAINDASLFLKQYSQLIATRGDNTLPKGIVNTPDVKYIKSATLPGNKALYSTTTTDEGFKGTADIIAYSRVFSMVAKIYFVNTYKDKDNLTARVKGDVLSLNDLKTIVEKTKKISELISAYQSKYENIKKVKRALINIGEKSTKALKKSKSDVSSGYINSYLNLYRWYSNQIDNPASSLNSMAVTTCRGLLVMVGDMVKVYK